MRRVTSRSQKAGKVTEFLAWMLCVALLIYLSYKVVEFVITTVVKAIALLIY